MSARQKDLRVDKTRRALVMALLALLKQRSFQKITVNDICEEALVGRSTFYLHFEDKYRLLHFAMEEIISRMRTANQKLRMEEQLEIGLAVMQEHSSILRNIFSADPNRELVFMLHEHYMGFFLSTIPPLGEDEMSRSMRARFFAGGVAALMEWWIDKGFPISALDMATRMSGLFQGLQKQRAQAEGV